MSRIDSPKCIRHPAEKLVGVCCSCLKERLTFLLNSIDAIAPPPPPTPSSDFNKDEQEDDYEGGGGGEQEDVSIGENQTFSDANVRTMDAKLVPETVDKDCKSIADDEGDSGSAASHFRMLMSNERSNGATCNVAIDQNCEQDRNLASYAGEIRVCSLPSCTLFRSHTFSDLRSIQNYRLDTVHRDNERDNLWRTMSVGNNIDTDPLNAEVVYPKHTLRALFQLEGDGWRNDNNEESEREDAPDEESPKLSKERRWCGCVTASACACTGRKGQSIGQGFLLRRSSSRKRRPKHRQKQLVSVEKDGQRQEENVEEQKEYAVQVQSPKLREMSRSQLKGDACSERRFNLAVRSITASNLSRQRRQSGPTLATPSPGAATSAKVAPHSTPSTAAAMTLLAAAPAPLGRSSSGSAGPAWTKHSGVGRGGNKAPLGDVGHSRVANKVSPATRGHSGLLWFYLAPHHRSARGQFLSGSRSRSRRASSSARAFKTLFLYK